MLSIGLQFSHTVKSDILSTFHVPGIVVIQGEMTFNSILKELNKVMVDRFSGLVSCVL